ncbi:hypothetical protein ACRQ5D_14325 [Mucilaginibacter sp. P25]|uniref:hypothetical protein n=1 Tax=unclassified Mucilaginibacter TaxID=2617802 RepID=UPI003D6783DF
MVFEEFLKKKRIDLVALEQGEPALFSEFKDHFEQMGEKSFDHTKKYWFNKLRRRFPVPLEVKTEKAHIKNPLAEQTITESLTEPATPGKVGFTPKFRPAAPKPAAPAEESIQRAVEPPTSEASSPETAPKPTFKPRFNPAMAKAKPAVSEASPENEKEQQAGAPATETPAPTAKPGFKPRFNAAMVKPKPAETETQAEDKKEDTPTTPPADAPAAKMEFKPRFNASMVKPKPVENEAPAEEKKRMLRLKSFKRR